MRKTIAAATVAASIAAGGVAGSIVGAPVVAGAAETADGARSWVEGALSGLVADGTITEAQSDAVVKALAEARPDRGRGHRSLGRGEGLAAAADAIGITEDELRAAVADGQTIAEIAAGEGVEEQAVVDAIVSVRKDHLDEAVAAGDLTQEQADEWLTAAERRATAAVNGEVARARGRHRGPGGHDRGAWRDEKPDDDDGDTAA